jgi:hypothetical protein
VPSTTREKLNWARRVARRQGDAFYLDHVLTPICRRAHAGYDPARTVSLLGLRRAGSTWLQELLSSGPGVCPLFEPLYGTWWRRHYGIGDAPVLGPDEDDPVMAAFLTEVMCGRRMTPFLLSLAGPRQVVQADRFVLKHVRLNMAAGWLGRTFPDSSMVVVLRHPCAVVESMQRVSWGPKTVARVLDDLPPLERTQVSALLDGRTSVASALAAVWAIEVGALLDQTTPATAQLVTYEHVWADVAGVLGPVMETAGLPRPPDLVGRASRPSHTANASSVVRGQGDPVTAWMQHMAPAARDEVLAVVRAAGVAGYDTDPRPDEEALRDRHGAAPS